MYKITLKAVKEACRKAHKEGRLLAQQESIKEYFYRRDNIGCAIGVSLPLSVAEEIAGNSLDAEQIDSEHFKGRILICDKDEYHNLLGIQRSHDSWAAAKKYNNLPNELEKAFLDLIQCRP